MLRPQALINCEGTMVAATQISYSLMDNIHLINDKGTKTISKIILFILIKGYSTID